MDRDNSIEYVDINETISAEKKDSEALKLIPLDEKFRFLNEPVHQHVSEQMYVRRTQLKDFQMRIQYSVGGTFLITGLRGVGKTSFVNQVLEEIELSKPTRNPLRPVTRILPISINLSRRMSATEIMYHIVRQIYSELDRKSILSFFSKRFRQLLQTAYQRTAFAVSQSHSKTLSQEGKISAMNVMNIDWAASKSINEGQVMEYLGYDDKAAEYDIIHILYNLSLGYRRHLRKWNIQPIIVFDEIDKLNLKQNDNREYLTELFSTLKTLLTTSGSIFVFIGGRELYRLWLEETRQPDSFFESIFAYDLYLPCLWDLARDTLEHFLDPIAFVNSKEDIDKIERHLSYIGRGIARRVIREFNSLVRWHDGKPQIVLDNKVQGRIRFFSDIEDLIRLKLLTQIPYTATQQERDEMRQSIYYIIDYILETDGFFLSVESIMGYFSEQEYYKRHQNINKLIREIVSCLLETRYIEEIESRTTILDQPTVKYYKLHQRILDRLKNIRQWSDESVRDHERMPFDGHINQFKLTRLITQGGLSNVYEARETTTEVLVVAKVLRPPNPGEQNLVQEEIFRREGTILEQNIHPNIVKLIDKGIVHQTPYLILELLQGISFQELINQNPEGLPLEFAIILIKAACEPILALHKHGYYRFDLKPENLFYEPLKQRVVLIDVGIALDDQLDENNPLRQIIGTKGYMAYEVENPHVEIPINSQSDIYVIAIILYVLLSGKIGHVSRSNVSIANEKRIDEALKRLLIKATALNPKDRFSTLEEFVERLPPSYSLSTFNSEIQNSVRSATKPAGREKVDWVTRGPVLRKSISPISELELASNSNFFFISVFTETEQTSAPPKLYIKQQALTIGRSTSNHLCLNYDVISRHLGQIQYDRDKRQLIFEVFRDTSPVYLNGQLLKEKQALKSGDQIQMWPVTLQIEWSE